MYTRRPGVLSVYIKIDCCTYARSPVEADLAGVFLLLLCSKLPVQGFMKEKVENLD